MTKPVVYFKEHEKVKYVYDTLMASKDHCVVFQIVYEII